MAALVYAAERVVPQLAPLLPPDAMNSILTRSMLALAEGVRAGWLAALAGVVIAIVAVLVAAKRFDGIVSRLPLVGALRRDLEIALCFFDLFVRLKSGIPLDTALAEAAVDAPNSTGARLEDCRRSLAAGHTFSGALAATCYFPRVVVETIRLGEEMGCYDGYCERIFKLYYQSFERRAQLLASVFQPAALALCAIFVAAMAFAFLQPVYGNLTRIGALNP
jgi:type II secretory pathway component PulF